MPAVPGTVLEWCRLIDSLLDKSADGRTLRDSIKSARGSRTCTDDVPMFGGMWIRNNTHLWQPGVAQTLAVDVRRIAQIHHVEMLASGFIVDAPVSTTPGIDNTLEHPDNLYWVLMCLYSDWLNGILP